jgi:hypothetical protein
MKPFAPNRRRGFLLLELSMYVGILAVACGLATQIFFSTARVLRNTDAHQWAQQRFDSAIRQLRGDVWSASRVECPDDHTLVLHYPNQSVVRWDFDHRNKSLSRTSPEEPRLSRWGDLPGLVFSSDGPALTVRAADEPGGGLVLPSQMMLAEREAR